MFLDFSEGISKKIPSEYKLPVFFTVWDESFMDFVLGNIRRLNLKGIRAVISDITGSLTKQLKKANKLGIEWVVIVGPDERKEGVIKIKNMTQGKEYILRS